jgi:hypothetical protein
MQHTNLLLILSLLVCALALTAHAAPVHMTWDAVPSAIAYQAELVPHCTGYPTVTRQVVTASIIMTLPPSVTSCVTIAAVDGWGKVGRPQTIRVTVWPWLDGAGRGIGYGVGWQR